MSYHLSQTPWHIVPEEILRQLDSDSSTGLTDSGAATRLAAHGPNQLHTRTGPKWPGIFISQFKSLLVLLLAVAALLGFAFSNWIEGTAICIVIVINAAIGFFTELGGIHSMESLRQFNAVRVTVRRNGRSKRIPAEELVPGDIALIKAGDIIAADLRLLVASRLQANESLLTGESFPVQKSLPAVPENTILAERSCMLYKGTSITRGTGEAIVTSTGLDTELGQISSLVLQTKDENTPLEKRLNLLGRKLIVVTVIITLFTFIMGLISGKDLYLMIETSIALAVAAIPEGLPIIATLALARGMWRMAKNDALINRLSAVETLGATNIICTDKTGTLTENKMTLDHLLPSDIDQDNELLQIGALCNKATADGLGDPIETALLQAALQKNITHDLPLLHEDAFDSETKRMATVHQAPEGFLVAVKGAPEAIIPLCTRIQTREGSIPFSRDHHNTWESENQRLASEGFRVLAFAKKTTSVASPPYQDLTFLGLACFIDPPREAIASTLDQCRQAGIRVIMVTGDQAGTALHVAREVHLISPGDSRPSITGKEFHTAQKETLLNTNIFARVTPKDKLDLIDLHQKNGSIVAMTGDGVNDAPALKKADIGIAMGQRGTEVAREASDMILRDDSFPSIIQAIRQGRIIFNNIRKFVVYLVSCNLSEILIVGLAASVNAPLPLLPLQILFLNMVTDVFPALALGASGGNTHVMTQPPRAMSEPLIGPRQWTTIISYSVIITASVLGSFAIAILSLKLPVLESVTISFLVLAIAQILHVFNMAEPGTPVFKNEITKNIYVWGALLLCLTLLAAALYVPLFARILHLTKPNPQGWCLVIISSLTPLIIGRLTAFLKKWPAANPEPSEGSRGTS